ncbi:MAG: hypothetical protein HY536_00790 [Candidatus Colwellbacteria bacterium]|nr:hypothetical protein [Candidatus Colwellbacteria bacterium]
MERTAEKLDFVAGAEVVRILAISGGVLEVVSWALIIAVSLNFIAVLPVRGIVRTITAGFGIGGRPRAFLLIPQTIQR